MAEDKVVYHGVTVVNTAPGPANPSPAPANPPPYTAGPPPPGHYGPPPPGVYAPPPGLYGTHVVQVSAATVPVIVTHSMGPNPARIVCKSCQAEIMTRVESKATMRTHCYAALLCLLGCWPCVCMPYCMDSCLNTDHYCPNCNAYIGSYLT